MAHKQTPVLYPERITVAISTEMREALKAGARTYGLSVADLVRDGIRLTAQLTPTHLAALKAGSARHAVDEATLVREAVEEYEKNDWGPE